MLYVVDDAADYRFLVQQIFTRFLPQYPIRLFGDGLDLIQSIDRPLDEGVAEFPRLILLDVDMPKLSGPQTLERLRQLPGWSSIPVVMVSNRTETSFVNACYERGACSFLHKPMGMEQMKTVLSLLCQYWLDLNQLPAPAVGSVTRYTLKSYEVTEKTGRWYRRTTPSLLLRAHLWLFCLFFR